MAPVIDIRNGILDNDKMAREIDPYCKSRRATDYANLAVQKALLDRMAVCAVETSVMKCNPRYDSACDA